ncbi:MAG TPA: flagellar basal body-associated FliL family protein [Sumerlaeia bacterium]|nr:flagellar basal body-associated FliL family protein [Sumerlaeia bacterium]
MGDDEKHEGDGPARSAAPAPKSTRRLILIVSVVTLLVAGGVVGGVFLGRNMGAKKAVSSEEETIGALEAEAEQAGSYSQAPEKDREGKTKEKRGGESSSGNGKQAGAQEDENLVIELPDIVTNLNSRDPRLKVHARIWVQATNAEAKAIIERQKHRLVSSILILLGGKSEGDITSTEGKLLLEKEIKARVDSSVGKGKTVAVGFLWLQTLRQ